MTSRTAEPTTAQGPRKGESSSTSMRYRLRPQPAQLVRGSSRRIMSMRFRPANIRVINRRARSSAVFGSAVRNPSALSSPTGTCSRSAAHRRSSECQNGARRARVRYAAPKTGAPLPAPLRSGVEMYAMGGSDGNTSRSARSPGKRKGRLPPTEEAGPDMRS